MMDEDDLVNLEQDLGEQVVVGGSSAVVVDDADAIFRPPKSPKAGAGGRPAPVERMNTMTIRVEKRVSE